LQAEQKAYIKVITTGREPQNIELPSGFTRKPAIDQEKVAFRDITGSHYSENEGEGKKKIRSYRFYFSSSDYLDYNADEIVYFSVGTTIPLMIIFWKKMKTAIQQLKDFNSEIIQMP